jgi:Zn-dependent peptidase ImmA (M78 family)
MTQSSDSFSLEILLNRVSRELNALARNLNPENTSWGNAKQAILEAATFLRLKTNQTVAPVMLNKIAQLRRIYRTEFFHDLNAPEATLVPMPKGFILKLPAGRATARYRFSIAHEIGHTFFYNVNASPPTRLLARGSSGLLSQKEEDICNAFAGELLMPREMVAAEQTRLRGIDNLDLLSHLAYYFRVSLECAAIRLLWDLSALETTIAIFKEANTRPRRYSGKAVRSPRKEEREILASVSEIIAKVPPFSVLNQLDKIRLENRDTLTLQWKVINSGQYQAIIVILSFHRSKKRPSSFCAGPRDNQPQRGTKTLI